MPGIGAMRLLGRKAIVVWARACRAGTGARERRRQRWRDPGGGRLPAPARRAPGSLPDVQGLPYATTDLSASQVSMREDACG